MSAPPHRVGPRWMAWRSAVPRTGEPRETAWARWGAFLRILSLAGRWKVAAFALLVLAVGALPTAVIVATGALVRAIPGAVAHGAGAAGESPAVPALVVLLAGLAALSLGTTALAQLARVLDAAFALEVHHEVAAVTLGTPGLAPLEDPAVADHLHAVHDAERRGVLRMAASAVSNVVATRLRGIGAFLVLLEFRWWAPVALAVAWHLTNRVERKATENGVSVNLSDGAVKMRRAEYLRSMVLDAPAAKEVRIFGLGPWVIACYGEAWLDALQVLWKSRRANRVLTAATTLALAASHAAVLAALGAAVSRGELGGAALLVYVQAVIATGDLGMLGDWEWFLAQVLAVSGRVGALRSRVPVAPLPAPAISATAEAAAAAAVAVAVRLEGVRFTYRGRATPTLDGLTLEVPAGQSLAVVGENGAGKSTLIKLLCGLYDPDAGRVVLDGAVSPARAPGRVGVIFQDFVRYPLPLRDNVAFGRLSLAGDRAALEGALRDAGAGRLPASLPRGWDTVLARGFDDGADLSGGEWQRVALARALAAVRGGAGLLVLDEPTAALDVRAETELFDRFLELTRGVTTILVSHRLSSVRRADRIVVIDGGRVTEDGTHDELMRANGAYAAMYALQAGRFAAAAVGHETGVEVCDA